MFIKREGLVGKIASCMSDFRSGRHEAGIATLMAAIDATAAKRYPTMKVGDRFQKFLAEEVGKVLGGIYLSLQNDLTDKRGKPVGDHFGAIYHLCRCFVLHEESYSEKIEFEIMGQKGVRIECREGKLIFNEGFLEAMFHAVLYAPENRDVFTEEVVKTTLAPLGRLGP